MLACARTALVRLAFGALPLLLCLAEPSPAQGQPGLSRPGLGQPGLGQSWAASDLAASSAVTVYTADWCSACKALARALGERGIPYEPVDVDREKERWDMARRASGANAIPLTGIVRGPESVWILGNNPDAIERAYRGG